MTTEKYDLEEVLDALMLAEKEPSYAALLRWTKRYPHFSKELETFFVSWSASELCKELPDSVDIDEKEISKRAVKQVLANRRPGRVRS